MPQPYDYSLSIPNPVGSFLQGIQIADQMAQQAAQKRAAEQRQTILRSLYENPNPTAEDYSRASLALPEDAAAFKQSWDMLEEAKRDGLFRGAFDAYLTADKPETAVAKLEEWATGYDNANDPTTAKMFRDAAEMVKADPAAARTTIGMMLAFADGERFKNLAPPKEDMTAFMKQLVSEGIEPNSPEWKEALRKERENVSVFIPNLGFISGSPDYIQSVVGGPLPATAKELPRPKTKEETDALPPGSEFIAPDRSVKRTPGGASGNAGGGFRPVSDAVPVMRKLFPQATITSGYRGPNHPLSKANPGSFHAKTKAAVDIVPIKGMTFEQAKRQLEQAGYVVHSDSRDEVKNPSSHATGPHWHFVIGER